MQKKEEMKDGREALTLQETQQIALEILHTVAGICEKLELRYYLVYGTLIGAVRHYGFIPWDDDVDIMMPRPDHDLLMEYLDEHISEYPHLEVFNRKTCPEYPYMITRISDSRYELVMENEKPFGMGIFIDIYPYDGLGNTKKEAVRFGMKGDRLSSLCYQATRDHFAIETTTSFIRKCMKLPVFVFCRLCGKERFQNALEKLAREKAARLIENKHARILAVESSCDETAIAIVRDGRQQLANAIASQIDHGNTRFFQEGGQNGTVDLGIVHDKHMFRMVLRLTERFRRG